MTFMKKLSQNALPILGLLLLAQSGWAAQAESTMVLPGQTCTETQTCINGHVITCSIYQVYANQSGLCIATNSFLPEVYCVIFDNLGHKVGETSDAC